MFEYIAVSHIDTASFGIPEILGLVVLIVQYLAGFFGAKQGSKKQ